MATGDEPAAAAFLTLLIAPSLAIFTRLVDDIRNTVA
jgi:hypothetical protein